MTEITFISNKAKKETLKYFLVIVFAVITWILQLSIFNQFLYFDAAPSLLLLGCIYWGLVFGPLIGTLFGVSSSFFCASMFHDHIFYFSYPLVGLFAGCLTKNLFSNELLFFILLSFLFTFPFEILNGWQYSLQNSLSILDRYLLISFNSASVNMLISPIFYCVMSFCTQKLKLH